jgi:hypothetical protein
VLYAIFDGTSHIMLEQLRRRLEEQSAQHDDEDALGAIRAIYSTPPTSLIATLRRRRASWPTVHCVSYAKSLASLQGIDLTPLFGLASSLVSLTRVLRESNRWGGDQETQFRAAHILAVLDALFALVEVCDKSRRSVLGMCDPPNELVHGYPFALGFLGARAASDLRALAFSNGLDASRSLDLVEREFCQLLRI